MSVRKASRWVAAAILVIALPYCSVKAGLNYAGYCFDAPYNRDREGFTSDDERIRKAIIAILGHYRQIRFVPDQMATVGRNRLGGVATRSPDTTGIEITEEQLILYRDIEEFMALNPNCCDFSNTPLYGDIGGTNYFNKLTGYDAGFANVKFQIRFRDSKGQIQSRWTGITYHETNCGYGLPY